VTRRVTQFLQRGVILVWLVDPEGRTVTVYRNGQLPQVLEGEDEVVCEDVLPGFRCRIADFFYLPGEENPPPPTQATSP
jgi:Uma2 family endonuclease